MKRVTCCLVCLGALFGAGSCGLTPPPNLRYYLEARPVLSDTVAYYIDPIDSSVVWSQEGLQVKVKPLDDQRLDAEYDPKISLYTLTGWQPTSWRSPEQNHTPPLWTVFDITVINRTRDRVELDPTQAVLEVDNPKGAKYYCAQGVGGWWSYPEYYNYSYLKWSSRAGNVHFLAANDRNQLWSRTIYQREKPVRKGSKYNGKLTFPPLPPEAREITLRIDRFILAFDRFAVGYGNPVEFTDLVFRFAVDQGVKPVEGK